MIVVLSLGGGVQSTALALMAAAGELEPMPACAIFADTQAEPAGVYRHLDWLEARVPFPVVRVTVGDLRAEVLGAMRGDNRIDARPPFYTHGGGMLNRQCTERYKIIPIGQEIRARVGIKRGSPGPRAVVAEQWIGISTDEASRMRDSRVRWLRNRYPLIERHFSRAQCLAWLAARGYPKPGKSACTFCPYHDDATWRAMKLYDAASFADAVAVDAAIRPGIAGPKRPAGESWYLHRSRVPLADVDFSTLEDHGQLNMFNEECGGVCGV